tara:strand:+ start:1814 stop:2149 length:336 start_codon:yes stop_codon:yes gene_type:complete
MKEPKTVFLECPVCKLLTEIEDPNIFQVFAGKTYGGDVTRSTDESQDLIFCEQCTATLWPKEYAVRVPKIFDKKPRKKRLTTKKKKRIIPTSKDENEYIKKKQSNRKSPRG